MKHACKNDFRYYYEEDFKRHRQRCLDLEVFQCQDCDFFSSSLKVQINTVAYLLVYIVNLQETIEHKMSIHLQ